MRAWINVQLGEAAPKHLGGYLTDAPGQALWGEEYTGSAPPQAPDRAGPFTRALCWYQGDFTVPTYQEPDDPPVQVPFVILEQRLDGDGPSIIATSPSALPLLAPDAPAGAGAKPARVSHKQPPGVRVVRE